jgi:glycosyltransferase involved in cell wall biosynthesis
MVVRKASAVTTPAKNLRQAMLAHGLKNENYFILPNVVDGERFVPSIEPFYDKNKNAGSTLKQLHEKRVKINETSGRIRFVHVSCFEDRSKNITGILNVLRQLADERNDWECFLVGDGVDREKMIRKAEAMKLCDAVHFTGLLEGHALVEAINSSAFMILFSWYETFSLVIKEAFACGVPVVTTAVGGIPETMNSDRGIMVSPGDEGGLLAGIKWMMEHYPEYDRDKIRDYALMNFSKEAVRQKLEYLYSTASGAR